MTTCKECVYFQENDRLCKYFDKYIYKTFSETRVCGKFARKPQIMGEKK